MYKQIAESRLVNNRK